MAYIRDFIGKEIRKIDLEAGKTIELPAALGEKKMIC
jgi:hypothetical protein